jgi:hypothetical protein
MLKEIKCRHGIPKQMLDIGKKELELSRFQNLKRPKPVRVLGQRRGNGSNTRSRVTVFLIELLNIILYTENAFRSVYASIVDGQERKILHRPRCCIRYVVSRKRMDIPSSEIGVGSERLQPLRYQIRDNLVLRVHPLPAHLQRMLQKLVQQVTRGDVQKPIPNCQVARRNNTQFTILHFKRHQHT